MGPLPHEVDGRGDESMAVATWTASPARRMASFGMGLITIARNTVL